MTNPFPVSSEMSGAQSRRQPVQVRNSLDRKAKVLLLPGRFRDAAYVRRHVAFVVGLDAERGEAHVQRNLDAIRRRLNDSASTGADADREVRSIEAAVRRRNLAAGSAAITWKENRYATDRGRGLQA